MQERLDQIKNKIKNEINPSLSCEFLLSDIILIADELTPKKKYKIRTEKPVWLANELLNMQKDRDYFYRKAKRSQTPHDWLVVWRPSTQK